MSAAWRIKLPFNGPHSPLSAVTKIMPRVFTFLLVKSGCLNSPTLEIAVSKISPKSSA